MLISCVTRFGVLSSLIFFFISFWISVVRTRVLIVVLVAEFGFDYCTLNIHSGSHLWYVNWEKPWRALHINNCWPYMACRKMGPPWISGGIHGCPGDPPEDPAHFVVESLLRKIEELTNLITQQRDMQLVGRCLLLEWADWWLAGRLGIRIEVGYFLLSRLLINWVLRWETVW